MPIMRTLDFYTTLGPADTVISGFFDRNPDAPDVPSGVDGMRVTPPQCEIAELAVPAGPVYYTLKLPGTGLLNIAGASFSFSPQYGDLTGADLEWFQWRYDASERTFTIFIRYDGTASDSYQLDYNDEASEGDRVYFCIHAFQSGDQSPTQEVA